MFLNSTVAAEDDCWKELIALDDDETMDFEDILNFQESLIMSCSSCNAPLVHGECASCPPTESAWSIEEQKKFFSKIQKCRNGFPTFQELSLAIQTRTSAQVEAYHARLLGRIHDMLASIEPPVDTSQPKIMRSVLLNWYRACCEWSRFVVAAKIA